MNKAEASAASQEPSLPSGRETSEEKGRAFMPRRTMFRYSIVALLTATAGSGILVKGGHALYMHQLSLPAKKHWYDILGIMERDDLDSMTIDLEVRHSFVEMRDCLQEAGLHRRDMISDEQYLSVLRSFGEICIQKIDSEPQYAITSLNALCWAADADRNEIVSDEILREGAKGFVHSHWSSAKDLVAARSEGNMLASKEWEEKFPGKVPEYPSGLDDMEIESLYWLCSSGRWNLADMGIAQGEIDDVLNDHSVSAWSRLQPRLTEDLLKDPTIFSTSTFSSSRLAWEACQITSARRKLSADPSMQKPFAACAKLLLQEIGAREDHVVHFGENAYRNFHGINNLLIASRSRRSDPRVEISDREIQEKLRLAEIPRKDSLAILRGERSISGA